MKEFDYLIVGQGIAGTTLGYTLIKAGKKVFFINKENPTSASEVAAGIVNPVTGKKMVLTWYATKLFPFLHNFYKEMEDLMQVKFFHTLPIYRPYTSVEEQNYWQSQMAEESIRNFVKSENPESYSQYIKDPFGGFEIAQGGYINLPLMLSSYRKILKRDDCYSDEDFSYQDLVIGDKLIWKGVSAKNIVFCDGISGAENPYFNWLPFSLTKGDILTIKSEKLKINGIVNKGGIFIVPGGEYIFRSGSTYERNFSDHLPSPKGRDEIKEKLEKILNVPFEIINHQSGVRPAVSDRRPLLGKHPDKKNIFIFNGLGTKGVSLAPYFAKQMTDFLIEGKDPESAVNISRFSALYTSATQRQL